MSDWKPQGCDYEGCLRVAVETVGVRYVCERHANFRINEPDKPPLELPKEPTWGIVLSKRPDKDDQHIADMGKWAVYGDEEWSPLERTHRSPLDTRCDVLSPENIAAFIPLTDEQVQRIEAAR